MRYTPLCLLLLSLGCSENDAQRIDSGARDVPATDAPSTDVTSTDVTSTDAATDAGPPCFRGTPRTRLEFLNRCTDAETTTKTLVLPLLRSDGTLPPLP